MELMNLNGAQRMSSLENKHNVYVLEFSNGVIKVGRGKVKSRIQSHTSMAGIFNIEKTKEFTCYAKDSMYVEGFALNWIRSKCTAQKSNEWFYGCNFDDVVKFIEESKDLVSVKKEKALIKPTSLQALKMAEIFSINVDLSSEEKILLKFPELKNNEVYKAVGNNNNYCHWALFCGLFSLAIKEESLKKAGIFIYWDEEILAELKSDDDGFVHEIIDEALYYCHEDVWMDVCGVEIMPQKGII